MGQDTSAIREEIETTRARMSDTAEALGYKADVPARVRDNVNERIESVKGSINEAVSGAKRAVTGTTRDVSDSASDTIDGLKQRASNGVGNTKRAASAVAQNPLGIALGALALGVLAGLVLPITDAEREKIGPLGDEVTARAKTAANEAMEAGKSLLSGVTVPASQSQQA